MMITKVMLKGFRGFRLLEVEPAPRLTLIVARNGSGKTSIIEGIAAALGGLARGSLDEQSRDVLRGLVGEMDHLREWPPDPALPQIIEKALTIGVTARWGDLAFSWQVHSQRSLLRKGAQATDGRLVWLDGKKELHDKLHAAARGVEPLPLLAALRAPRASRGDKTGLPAISATASVPAERLPRWGAAPWLDVQWYSLRDQWFELETRRRFAGDRAEAACQSLESALMRALSLAEPPRFNADAEDFLVKLPDEGWRSIGLTSDGYRAYISTIAAVTLRCTELNPAQPDAAAVTPGALLIDEIEQHLHPQLQLRIVNGLQRAFPLLQIIATTHSPLVLTDITAGDADRVLRLDRVATGAIGITPLLAPVGRNAVQVLTGEWFGLPSTLDDETLQMLARHRSLLRRGPAVRDERKVLEEELRRRIGRYAETSVEELVLSVLAELEGDAAFEELTHEQMVNLRKVVIERIKESMP